MNASLRSRVAHLTCSASSVLFTKRRTGPAWVLRDGDTPPLFVASCPHKRRSEPTVVEAVAPKSQKSAPKDLGVERNRRVLHIPLVERILFVDADQLPTINLRPSGQPRRDGKSQNGWAG